MFPFDEYFSIGEEEFPFLYVIVDGFKDVEQDSEHVAAVFERDLFIFDANRIAFALLIKVFFQEDLEDFVVALILEHVVVCELLAVEDNKDAEATTDLNDLVHLHAEFLGQLDFLHEFDEVLGVSVLSDL